MAYDVIMNEQSLMFARKLADGTKYYPSIIITKQCIITLMLNRNSLF